MHSTKRTGTTRLVWRMTAENHLGEILELPDESRSPRSREVKRSQRTPSQHATPPASLGASTGFASRIAADPSSWRASSYDLQQGLRVRDVTQKISQRAFDALFSEPAATRKL